MKRIKLRRYRVVVLSLLVGLSVAVLSRMLGHPPVAKAATTITVTSGADAGGTCPGGSCTLRQAIATAASDDTINFAAGLTTITLTSGELLINKRLFINGPGANLLTVRRSAAAGTPQFRIFDIDSTGSVISGLSITNGSTGGNGGGIFNNPGSTPIVRDCTISGNTVSNGGDGGGIFNSSGGTLTIISSTISGNTASSISDGSNGGGIINNGTVTITNSTISGNTASDDGGGISNNSGTLNLTNVSIAGNSAGNGGGISNNDTVNARNTIIAKNTGGAPDFSGVLTSQGYDLIGNTSFTTITGITTGNQLNVDPLLGPLQNNGGPTFTRAPLANSPAIDKGESSGSTTDQRGSARPIDTPAIANATGGDGSDIGAYEVPASQLSGCGNTVVTDNNDSGSGSLRFLIQNACTGETITFASSVTSPINLTSDELLINKNLTISGPGANLLTVQRNATAGNFRIFHIPSGNFNVTISSLTIANGNAPGASGGGILLEGNNGFLTVTGCTISGNSAGAGGGIYNSEGSVTLTNSTISGNLASADGGGVYNGGFNDSATLDLTNSTVSGNSAGSGGGIFNVGPLGGGGGPAIVNLRHGTLSGNSASGSGGGIYNQRGSVTTRNTIIARNTAASSGPDFNGSLTSQDFNLIGNTNGMAITGTTTGNQLNVDPLLGPLQNNGGPTFTQALLSGSTAIDGGNSTGSTTDQRGFIRPVDSPALVNATGGDGADIGAFEVQTPTPPPMTIQFSAANYLVGEGDQHVDLSVTRLGDSSGAASVNFITSDLAGAQNCNVVNGAASSRCDYETNIRTVQFAAGETSRTVSVFIIDDSYLEGPETFNVSLTNAAGASLGAQSNATVTINDNEIANGANPIDAAGFFVRLHYLDFLNREPDSSGFPFWTNQIDSCGSDQQCVQLRRINVSAAFYLSIEFQQTGYLVHRIYKTAYGDAVGVSTLGGSHQIAVPIVRLNEFLPDTQKIGQGVIVGQTGWEQVLESNKQAFCAEFVQRSRFASASPTTLTAAQFVDALFANAGVTPTATERQAAIDEFGGAGTSGDLPARGRVLRRVAENSTLAQQESNRAFVLMQFFGYLRRNPNDPQDSDYTGYDFWLGKLNQFNGNFVSAEMVKAFIVSGEYQHRFGP